MEMKKNRIYYDGYHRCLYTEGKSKKECKKEYSFKTSSSGDFDWTVAIVRFVFLSGMVISFIALIVLSV